MGRTAAITQYSEGVPRVVNASLNALVQGPAIWGCLVTEPGVDGWRQVAGHAVVVLPQVGVLSTVGGDTSEFFGVRGPQHLCLCSTETLGAGMGWELREGSNIFLIHSSWEEGGSYRPCRARAGRAQAQGWQ